MDREQRTLRELSDFLQALDPNNNDDHDTPERTRSSEIDPLQFGIDIYAAIDSIMQRTPKPSYGAEVRSDASLVAAEISESDVERRHLAVARGKHGGEDQEGGVERQRSTVEDQPEENDGEVSSGETGVSEGFTGAGQGGDGGNDGDVERQRSTTVRDVNLQQTLPNKQASLGNALTAEVRTAAGGEGGEGGGGR